MVVKTSELGQILQKMMSEVRKPAKDACVSNEHVETQRSPSDGIVK